MAMDTLFNIGAIIFIAVGVSLVTWGACLIVKCLKVAGWRKVEGAMHACGIKESIDSEGGPLWCLEVAYSYSVSGKQYNGNRIAYGYLKSDSHGEHLALYDKLSTVQTVIVRYNPSNPSESALTYGLHSSPMLLGVGGLVVVSGVLSIQVKNEVIELVAWVCLIALVVLLGLSKVADKWMRDRIEILEWKTANKSPEDTARKLAAPQR